MSGPLEDLEAYFAGELAGAPMRVKSSLGSLLDYGCKTTTNGHAATEMAGSALVAARAVRHVEERLAMLTVEQRAVLAAFYAPRGRGAPLDQLIRRADGGADRVEALPSRVPGLKRDVAAVACVIESLERIRQLGIAATGPKGPEKLAAQRQLRNISGRARTAVRRAHEAYADAIGAAKRVRREQRRVRFLRDLGA